ncbi:unnamed protein product, partial [Brenthis ino]
MSLTWTNELTETLIDLYHKHNMLWDQNDEDYKNKIKRKEALEAISGIMGIHELELKRKIKNLTTQFFRERKKTRKECKSGGLSGNSKWFAYQRLLFLTDTNKSRSCMEKDSSETNDFNPETSTAKVVYQNRSPVPDDATTHDSIVELSLDRLDSEGCSTKSDNEKIITGSKRNFLKAYNDSNEREIKKSRNEFTIFGEYVANKIEALNTSYAQNVVEHLISNILFEASIGKYDYPTDAHIS